jgi:hypothetical protein
MRDALRARVRKSREDMLKGYGPTPGRTPRPVSERAGANAAPPSATTGGDEFVPRAGGSGADTGGGDGQRVRSGTGQYEGRGTYVSGVDAGNTGGLYQFNTGTPYDSARGGDKLEQAINHKSWAKKLWERLFGDDDDEKPKEKEDK